MKRTIAIAALASILLLAGCGGGGDGSDASDSPSPRDTAAAEGTGTEKLIDACKLLPMDEASEAVEAEVTVTFPASTGATSSCGFTSTEANGVPLVLLYVYPPEDTPMDGDPIPGLGDKGRVTPLYASFHGKKHNFQVAAKGDDDAQRKARSIAALKAILANAGEV